MSYLRYLCLCFVFLGLVYPMLPVSLNCPFLIIADDGVKQQVQYNNRTNS